jgi:hypothetical protein
VRFRVVALAGVALAAALVGVGATTLTGGNERFDGGPRLDAERLIGQQNGDTPGVATCPVSQQAVETTKLRAVRGTLAHAYLDNPESDQRAQLLAGIFIHEKPLENGMFGSHPEVNEALGPHAVVGTWNLKLHPFRGSESVVVRHALHWNWTIPKGHFVTLCIWVNNTHHGRLQLGEPAQSHHEQGHANHEVPTGVRLRRATPVHSKRGRKQAGECP